LRTTIVNPRRRRAWADAPRALVDAIVASSSFSVRRLDEEASAELLDGLGEDTAASERDR